MPTLFDRPDVLCLAFQTCAIESNFSDIKPV